MSDAATLLPAGGRGHDRVRAELLAQALAPGVTTDKYLVLEGEPASKARHRTSRDGRTYKTSADSAAEARTAWALRRAFKEPWTGNLALGAVFFRPDRRRMDVDNLLKHICDAGNGIAWVDDAQITAVYGVAELDAGDPRTLLVVVRHVSSLVREPSAPRAVRLKAVTR